MNEETPDPVNSFVRLDRENSFSVGMRAKIKITPISAPENQEFQFFYQPWFDGEEVTLGTDGGKIFAESGTLTAGLHQWAVQTLLVNKRTESSYDAAIKVTRNERWRLQKAYENETDSVYKEQLLAKILLLAQKMQQLSEQRLLARKVMGSPLIYNFEVE